MPNNTENQVILHHHSSSKWLLFQNPYKVLEESKIENILPALRYIEDEVQKRRMHAAGFLSYEASRAFDPAFYAKPTGEDFPLLWFGLYKEPEEIELPEPDYSAYSLGEIVPSVSRDEYRMAISRIKDHIHSGDTYQVNYTLQLQIPFSGDPWNLFLSMVRAQSPGYAAWVDTGRFAICSASPELFFMLDGDHLICKPMKGTVKRGRTLAEDKTLSKWLQASEKNRAENLMIVDMVRNDIGRIARAGSVSVDALFEIERHPTLWQMTSTISAKTQNRLSDILAAIFPCASITGAPKIRTTRIIAELEKTPRNLYTGSIGCIDPDVGAQFNVAIRTAVIDRLNRVAAYGAGGGIVWDSLSDEEYREAILKSRILTEQHPDFSLLESILWSRDEGFFLMNYHMKRLVDSAEYFGYPADIEFIEKRLHESVSGLAADIAYKIRLLVNREGEIEIVQEPLITEDTDTTVKVRLASDPISDKNIFLYHKTTLRHFYDSALRKHPDCDDVIFYNERKELTESTIANIVLDLNGELFTPPVVSGLLAGVYRAHLLEQETIKEKVLNISDLQTCNSLYVINSVRKWRRAVLV